MSYRVVFYDEGLFSARPAASVGNGYAYFATDTGNLYRSNGATWTLIASTGGGGSPTGAAGGVLDGTYPNPGLAAGVAGAGLAETADVLSVNVDGSTLEINADALRVKALGITDAQVATANKDGTAGTASLRTLGTGAAQATAGNDSRLSDSRAPNGAAGGDLTGTYPNPTLAAAGPGAAGPIGDSTHVAAVTIDAKGRVTALSSVAITGTGGAASDGWVDDTAETWTFATASTFTVTGDQTAKYQKGTRIKLTQTTVKYFVCVGSSFGGVTTTVTITGGSDYTFVNAAVSLNYHSYAASPQGYPGWFNFTASPTGFSGTPTVNWAKFAVVGRDCRLEVNIAGTSNATTFGFTLGIAPGRNSEYPCKVTNGGTTQTAPGNLQLPNGSTAATINLTFATTGGWSSGAATKAAAIQAAYEI